MKKTIALCAAVLSAALLGAQTSNTNLSTAGTFGTDVDSFMSVTGWSGVDPQNLFGYVEVNNGIYSLGFAHKFAPLYWGTYFSGSFGAWSNETTTVTNGGTTDTSKENASDNTAFTFDNIIGIGNFGFKLGFSYADNGSSYEATDSNNYTKIVNKSWGLSLSAGTSATLGGVALTPYATISYDDNVNGNSLRTTAVAGTVTKTGSKDSDLSFLFGTDIGLPSLGEISQTLNVELGLGFILHSASDDTDFSMGIAPSYTAKYDPNDTVGFAATAKLPMSFTFGNNSSFYLRPELDMGATFKLKEKFTLNGGLDFAIPVIYNTTTKATVLNTTTKVSTWGSNGDDGHIGIYTGFNYDITSNIAFDFAWNIGASVFGNNFTTDWDTGSSADAFFGNLNKIFTNMSFLVSFKF